MEEITELKAKKKRMEEDMRARRKSANHNAEKAETEGNCAWSSKSCNRKGNKSGGFGETANRQTQGPERHSLKNMKLCVCVCMYMYIYI